jgi:hypothetical protein
MFRPKNLFCLFLCFGLSFTSLQAQNSKFYLTALQGFNKILVRSIPERSKFGHSTAVLGSYNFTPRKSPFGLDLHLGFFKNMFDTWYDEQVFERNGQLAGFFSAMASTTFTKKLSYSVGLSVSRVLNSTLRWRYRDDSNSTTTFYDPDLYKDYSSRKFQPGIIACTGFQVVDGLRLQLLVQHYIFSFVETDYYRVSIRERKLMFSERSRATVLVLGLSISFPDQSKKAGQPAE